jgi:hypothetical protein
MEWLNEENRICNQWPTPNTSWWYWFIL